MGKKLTIIILDDWEILYGPDGKMLSSSHVIYGESMFKILKDIDSHPAYLDLTHEYIEDIEMINDLFDGSAPNNLSIIREYQETHKK